MKELWELYITFAEIGVSTFGGGYAMLPILEREIVEEKKWATNQELLDYYAISQCTPGIIAINTATFVGNKIKGVSGGIAATLGMVTPCLIIITIIAAFLENFASLPMVQSAFVTIRIAVSALVLNSVLKMWKSNMKNKENIIIGMIALVGYFFFGVSSIGIIIFGIIAGIILPKFRKGV